MKLIRPCEWEEIFLIWYENEGKDTHWTELAKERGFFSWADWRIRGYARRFKCAEAKWGLYEIENPSEIVPNWYGGPFRTWIERHYDGGEARTFGQMANQSDIFDNLKIKSMVEGYPAESIIIALRLKDGKIVVIEGSHRSCALAVMAQKRKKYQGKLIFAIGESELSELPEAGQNTIETDN